MAMFLTNLNSDSSHPSFFEMFAQGALISSLKPALKHMLAVLGRNYSQLESASEYTDEIFHTLLFILERHFLREHDSTFAEHFYSLKRVLMLRGADPNASAPALLEESATLAATSPAANPAASNNEFAGSRIPESSASSSAAIPLPKNPQLAAAVTLSQQESEARGERELQSINRTRALFFLIVVPYLKCKAEAWYAAATDPTLEHVLRDYEESLPWLHRYLRRMAITLYPWLHTAYEGTHLGYQIAYLFGRTPYFTPWLHALSQRVRRIALHDMWASDHRAKNPRALPSLSIGGGVSIFQWLRNFVSRTSHWAAEYAKWGIVGAVFAFKLMEWYHSAEAAAAGVRNDKGVLPVPPPPEPAKSAPGALALPTDPTLCPICRRVRTNPAAPACSGVVFCYPCIHTHVAQRQQCPVTLLPCTTELIRKIFLD